ncbi:MAG: argininosuccinate lyase [Oscillospiraceae bacterium]
MKMWTGRFSKQLDSGTNDFNSSISFDHVMYEQDIKGSIAHVTMLGKQGIIPNNEAELIAEDLAKILAEIKAGTIVFDMDAEDIHMFVEQILTERLGDVGKKLHTGRSRNDQVALDVRMYLKVQTKEIYELTRQLAEAIIAKAELHLYTIMPGYTHMQIAQPVTFAHHVLAYAQMFVRDLGRLSDCYKRMNIMPLGSGALASTTYPIDRQLVCDLLGFDSITQNSLDGVSDRDFCVELGAAISLIMTHLSRFCEEIIIWCSSEYKFIELDDAFATGSSIMPQKKNPDIAELIRGKAGRVNGNLVTLLTMMKGLPLAYNKDMQEDKQAIFDSADTVKLCLKAFTPMFVTMTENKDNMRAAAAKGFINATDCADYMTKKGMPFRDAYKITGQLVALCIEKGCTLETLDIKQYKKAADIFEDDIYMAIDLKTCVEQRKAIGGPAPEAVTVQIANLKQTLEGLVL